MRCEHMHCGNTSYSYTEPLPARWIVRHSGYVFPVCNPHYGVLRDALILGNVVHTVESVEGVRQ